MSHLASFSSTVCGIPIAVMEYLPEATEDGRGLFGLVAEYSLAWWGRQGGYSVRSGGSLRWLLTNTVRARMQISKQQGKASPLTLKVYTYGLSLSATLPDQEASQPPQIPLCESHVFQYASLRESSHIQTLALRKTGGGGDGAEL